MKTMKSISMLLLFVSCAVFATTDASAGDVRNARINPARGIHHRVNVILPGEYNSCRTYVIEIRDGQGQLVAPGQVFNGSVETYDFYERGPATGIRFARLIEVFFGDPAECEYQLHAAPVMIIGKFNCGETYRYDLVLVIGAQKE